MKTPSLFIQMYRRELIRAMDARLNALHEEQIMAFARANAAGFDDKSITDLVHFAENFGAERLKYVNLYANNIFFFMCL